MGTHHAHERTGPEGGSVTPLTSVTNDRYKYSFEEVVTASGSSDYKPAPYAHHCPQVIRAFAKMDVFRLLGQRGTWLRPRRFILPMSKLPIDDPHYWRERAEEARRIAEQLADAVAKQTMLDIARSYDNLAKITETGAASKPAS